MLPLRRAALQAAPILSGGAVFLILAAWNVRHLNDALLYWALGYFLLFAAFHTALPILLARVRPTAATPRWAQIFPALALVLLLWPAVRSGESAALWAAVLLADFAAIVLALVTASTLGVVARAFVITLDASDFTVSPLHSSVTQFSISIDIDAILAPGTYSNPALNGVSYNIFGSLAPGTPSGFSAFNLVRNIGGAEYYSQGSSLSFTISPTANLLDGLQLSELSGPDPVFEFNAREVDTGRYHPTLLRLNGDGTGRVQNSNNFGANTKNPQTMQLVDVDFGEEYISDLSANPATLTLAPPVPEPGTAALLGLGTLALLRRRRNGNRR